MKPEELENNLAAYRLVIRLVGRELFPAPNFLREYKQKLESMKPGDPLPTSLGLPLLDSYIIWRAYVKS